MKPSSFKEDLEVFRKVFGLSGIRLTYFLPPFILSIFVALFEGISIGLLIPLLNCLASRDFSYIEQNKYGARFLEMLPPFIRENIYYLFTLLFLMVIGATVIRISLLFISEAMFTYKYNTFCANIRSTLFDKLLNHGKLFFDQHKAGELSHIIITLGNQMIFTLCAIQSRLLNLFMLFAYLGLMIYISPQLTLVVICLAPLYWYSVNRITRSLRYRADTVVELESKLTAQLHDVASNVSLVQSYGQEQVEQNTFRQLCNLFRENASRMQVRQVLLYPVQELISLLLVSILVAFIGYLLHRNPTIRLAEFLVYFYSLRRFTSSLSACGSARGFLAQLFGICGEINRLREYEFDYAIPSGEKEYSGLQKAITVSNLSFAYLPDQPVLHDVSLSFPKGSISALVGPSGSGKTTLVHLLLRLYDCPPGTIFIDGVDIRAFQLTSLRSRIALVSQETAVFNRTLRENISYGTSTPPSDDRLFEALEHARLADFVATLPDGLDTQLGDRGVLLSGGQRQRVSIARAILREPEILILDEATSSLDATTEQLVQAALDELVVGRTVIVIAHRFSTLRHADQIITLAGGKVLEQGRLEDLLNAGGMFSQLWKAQELFR